MNFDELCKQAGFAAGYLLPVPQYDAWTRRRASGAFAPQTDWIEGDAAAAWPWANGLLLLIWPYAPFAPDAILSGYYPASNQSYHAMVALRRVLEAAGVRTERAAVPVKTILVDWGLATAYRITPKNASYHFSQKKDNVALLITASIHLQTNTHAL